MNQQQGFSLIEVLLSLLLVTTLVLVLLQQHLQGKSMLNQLIIRTQTTHYRDQSEASLQLRLQHTIPEAEPRLVWNKPLDSLTHRQHFIELQ